MTDHESERQREREREREREERAARLEELRRRGELISHPPTRPPMDFPTPIKVVVPVDIFELMGRRPRSEANGWTPDHMEGQRRKWRPLILRIRRKAARVRPER